MSEIERGHKLCILARTLIAAIEPELPPGYRAIMVVESVNVCNRWATGEEPCAHREAAFAVTEGFANDHEITAALAHVLRHMTEG